MDKLLHIIVGFTISFLLFSSCQKEHPYTERDRFFLSPKFGGDFYKTFSLLDADTVVYHIKTHIPKYWQGIACEGAYYSLTSRYEDVSDSIQFRLLDKMDAMFPEDSTHTFTQMIRGELFIDMVRYDTASKCLQNAYDLSLKINNLTRATDIKNVFARLALRQGDYPEATKLFLDNYYYISQLDDYEERGRKFQIYKSLIHVYHKSHNFKEAHQWCLSAWAFAQTRPLNMYALEATTMLAENYLQIHQLDSAQIMIDSAFYFQHLYQNNFNEALRHSIQGRIYLGRGNCKDALLNFKLAIKTNKDQSGIALNQYDKELADSYACLGRLDSAIYFYQAALVSPDTVTQLAVLQALGKTHILRGDYAKAYDYERQSQELRNRIFTNEKEQAIGRMHATSEVAMRERLLAEKEKQTQLNRAFMLGALLILSVGLVVGLLRFYRKKQELRLAEQEKHHLEQEKKRIEAEAQLKEQALIRAEQELVVKDIALEETAKLLDLKNVLIQELEMKLTEEHAGATSVTETQLYNLKILTAEDWHTFRALFEQRYPSFFSNIHTRLPKLTPAEVRLLLLTKLRFEIAEISNVLGISITSVYTSRSRLRKRLGLSEEDDLEKFVAAF